jgi:hypothetical protein
MTARYPTGAPDADWKAAWAGAGFNPYAWRNPSAEQLVARELHDRLVELGGWAACVRDLSLAPVLLAEGTDVSGEGAEMRLGRARECHQNSAALVRQDPTLVCHYGYALSDDGMWREHSWCVKPDGGIIETTVERVAYFGAPDRD